MQGCATGIHVARNYDHGKIGFHSASEFTYSGLFA